MAVSNEEAGCFGMIFLSLGGGVQSTVMLMRAIHGDIERPDHVLFADTGWEHAHTIEHVEWCEQQCIAAGIPLHWVSNGNIFEDAMSSSKAENALGDKGGRWAAMPWFVDMGHEIGQAKRQCTNEYKMTPLRRKQRELLGYKPRQRIPPASAVMMVGISVDEARRAAPSRDLWVDNVFPLIDPLRMSRGDCQAWWEKHYPNRALRKSACIGCPYQTDRNWLELKLTSPSEFAQAVELDEAIRRRTGMKHECYLHRSCIPLIEVDFNEGQDILELEEQLYCSGGCGL